MKKIFTSALLAIMFFAFGCSKQQDECKISAENFANATPENVSLFAAYGADAELIKKNLAQKGFKEFIEELAKNKKVQEDLNLLLKNLAEKSGKKTIPSDVVNKVLLKCANSEDGFFIGASLKKDSEDLNFKALINSPLVTEIFEDFAKNIEKTQKNGASIYSAGELGVIVVKENSIVFAKSEKEAEAFMENLKKPLEKSFAKTQKFAKLSSIKESADLLLFADVKEDEKEFAQIFVSAKYLSPTQCDTTVKVELGKDADSELKDAFKMFGKRTLPNGSFLKNSAKDSSLALAAAIPELGDEASQMIKKLAGDDAASIEMPLQMIKFLGLKDLYFSCGELKAEEILKIQETMQPPEMFLKIDCENSDAFFNNPMIAPMLNSPFISQMQVGGNPIYTTMANIKFAPIGKGGAFISTITDLAKITSLSNNSGESLADNKDAEHLFNRLPSGNQIELFCDGKKMEDIAKAINDMQMGQIREFSDEDMGAFAKTVSAINEFSRDITKKSMIAAALKVEETLLTINFAFLQELDFEKAVKILKELK